MTLYRRRPRGTEPNRTSPSGRPTTTATTTYVPNDLYVCAIGSSFESATGSDGVSILWERPSHLRARQSAKEIVCSFEGGPIVTPRGRVPSVLQPRGHGGVAWRAMSCLEPVVLRLTRWRGFANSCIFGWFGVLPRPRGQRAYSIVHRAVDSLSSQAWHKSCRGRSDGGGRGGVLRTACPRRAV